MSHSIEKVRELRMLRNALQKTVTVEVGLDDLKALKVVNYKLCFAKKVAEGDYNVVWQSLDKYLANNIFSWTPQYQLFGANQFAEGLTVAVSTNMVTIGLGEISTLSPEGVLCEPVSGGVPTALNLKNEYGSIHAGVKQLCTLPSGELSCSPIYLSSAPVMKGEIKLTPVEKVMVWFQQNVATSTMFSTAITNALEIDLTEVNSRTCRFENEAWRLV